MKGAAAGGGALLVAVIVCPMMFVLLLAGSSSASCAQGAIGAPAVVSAGQTFPELAGLSTDPTVRVEQLSNAAAIMRAATDLGMTVRAQEIGVMTAMGESSLRVIDHGDAVGPDSRGLFQQRDNGAWGSYSDRMDQYISATNFFRALARVAGWEQMEPTLAAHAVQRNADANHYTKFYANAAAIVAALSGTDTQQCSDNEIAAGEWTKPLTSSRLTSPFGYRKAPIAGTAPFHTGVDLAAPCGTPIYAAAAGTVIAAAGAGSDKREDLVAVDNGGGIVTRYHHMYTRDIAVTVGQKVTTGQQIAAVGTAGEFSTGCHLHFEFRVNGEAQDPITSLADRGVNIP